MFLLYVVSHRDNSFYTNNPHRLADVIMTQSAGIKNSILSTTDVPNQWHMTVTWAPTTSEAGPTTSVFCFYAVDVVGYVCMHIINYYYRLSLTTITILMSAFY